MKRLHLLTFLLTFLFFSLKVNSQIIQRTGYIYSDLSAKISAMPGDSGNHYKEPSNNQINTWERTLLNLFSGNYSIASDSANSIGYQLVHFTDTFVSPYVNYYVLETVDTNYWGTYVYNPNYCRPLVIQSPHAKKDANTGLQGIHVFRKTQALFFQVNGTHRCNSNSLSSCTGTTTGCSINSQAYPISDLAHNTQSIFQKTTEVLFNQFNNTFFIQLHGFTKLNTDPYAIISNGTQQIPSPDYHSSFAANLYNEDTVLTFQVAHINTNWTRLRGFWNTQARLINNSTNPCNLSSSITSGRFMHLEQERTRLRSTVSGWNKVVNAINNTFSCNSLSVEDIQEKKEFNLYPNPSNNSINIESSSINLLENQITIYNLMGQDITNRVSIQNLSLSKSLIDISQLKSGVYLIKIDMEFTKMYKH